MNQINIIIKKGEYDLNKNLSIIISKDIEFIFGNTFFLVGENGIGKTSFIEKLLIPKLIELNNKKNNFFIFYASQDFTIQYYVIKSYYNGLLNKKINMSSFNNVINFIKNEFLSLNKKIFFILDEIDQYTDLLNFIKNIQFNNNYCIVLVSHKIRNIKNSKKVFFHEISKNKTKVILNERKK